MKTLIRRIGTLLSYARQGRASRKRCRAGGYRWTLDGWTSESTEHVPTMQAPKPLAWVSTERSDGRTVFTYEVDPAN